MADDLTLVVGGAELGGWDDVTVTRGIEQVPNSFNVKLTEKYPGQANAYVASPGDKVQVYLGADLAITGYVDRYNPRITADEHEITMVGRSKSRDLVDCSAEWPGGQISGANAQGIAQKLATPYGITINADGDVGPPIPQFNLTLGETGYSIIERIARYRGLLVYDNPDGSVQIGAIATGTHSSGVVQGTNFQSGDAMYSDDERFSNIDAWLQSTDTFTDTGNGGNLIFNGTDPGQKNHRLKDVIAEAGGGGQDVAKQRAIWEINRRAGRSYVINATVDSWRESEGGALWTPGWKIPVTLPILKVPPYDWVIGTVTHRKNASSGTTSDLLIMPKPAFLPEPILLQPFAADVPPGGG